MSTQNKVIENSNVIYTNFGGNHSRSTDKAVFLDKFLESKREFLESLGLYNSCLYSIDEDSLTYWNENKYRFEYKAFVHVPGACFHFMIQVNVHNEQERDWDFKVIGGEDEYNYDFTSSDITGKDMRLHEYFKRKGTCVGYDETYYRDEDDWEYEEVAAW